MNIDDVKPATEKEHMMQTIINICKNRRRFQICKSDDPMMREFYKVREELIVTDDSIILRGTTEVIP